MITLTLAALLAAALPASALDAELAPGSVLWIEGDSTLHPYSSTSTALTASVALPGALEEGAAGGGALTLAVPVDSLKSAHAGLDKNLRKALRAESHPDILFTAESLAPRPGGAAASGVLSVAGSTRAVTVEASLEPSAEGLRARGAHRLKMTDFGIKPPVMMLGAIKTADEVVVRFDLILRRKP